VATGTGNKVEDLAKFYTKYGDGGVDLSPIADFNEIRSFALQPYLKSARINIKGYAL
jgi:NAD+ synthase